MSLGATKPLTCVGNVSFAPDVDESIHLETVRNQPWGAVADFRVYHRELKPHEIGDIAKVYNVDRDVYTTDLNYESMPH